MARRERLANAGVFRYEPRAQKFEVYVSLRLCQSARPRLRRLGPGHRRRRHRRAARTTRRCSPADVEFPDKHRGPPQVYKQRTRPCPGIEYLSSTHFPDDMQGNLLVGNVIGFQGILRYKIEDKGASFERHRIGTDPFFHRSELSPGRLGDRPRRRAVLHRLAEPDHRPHAAQLARSEPRSHARPRLSRDLRRPPVGEAGQDRRRADRQIAGPVASPAKPACAIGPGSNSVAVRRPKCLPAVDRWLKGLDQRNARVRAPSARSAVGASASQSGEPAAVGSPCWPRKTSMPGRRRPACFAIGATA